MQACSDDYIPDNFEKTAWPPKIQDVPAPLIVYKIVIDKTSV